MIAALRIIDEKQGITSHNKIAREGGLLLFGGYTDAKEAESKLNALLILSNIPELYVLTGIFTRWTGWRVL